MKLAHDKILHVAAGTFIGLVVFFITGGNGLFAFLAALIAGLGKEYLWDRDRRESHTVDPMDAFWTAVPGALIWLASSLHPYLESLPHGAS